MRRCSLVLLAGVLLSLSACARARAAEPAGSPDKEPLSALEVERGLVLPRGWWEVGVTLSEKVATGEWGPDGARVEWDPGTRWALTTAEIAARWGFAPRNEVYGALPVLAARLRTAEGVVAAAGLGDARVGWRVEWLRERPPTAALATAVEVAAPTGRVTAGAEVGAMGERDALALGSGVVEVVVRAQARRQVGPLAVTAEGAGVHRLAGAPSYRVAEAADGAVFDAGDEGRGGVGVLIQAGPLALAAPLAIRGWTHATTSSKGGGAQVVREPGWGMEVAPAAIVDVSRGCAARITVTVPLRGAEAALFPLEALSPSRGITYAGQFVARW